MKQGQLYIVATPIGNLTDISQRAIDTLKSVSLIAAEDTRHSRKLLASLGISVSLTSLHDHNERDKSAQLVDKLKKGEDIALISDAGTPMISDPGYHLVRAAQQAGITVSPIPGPSAVISALSASGLPANRFYFYGFLPEKSAARKKALQSLKTIPETLAFYESGKRIAATMADIKEIFGGEREVVIARELTKLHETILRDSVENILAGFNSDELEQRGEFVLLVEGSKLEATEYDSELVDRLIQEFVDVMPAGKLASVISKVIGAPRKIIYQMILDFKEDK